jgi:hypothetical protein
MLAIGLSYIAFIMLRYFPSIPSFLGAFIMKWCWILSMAFSVSIEMIKCFLSLLLLMWFIMFIDFHMLNHPCIPGMKPTWSWWMIFWCAVEFGLLLFYFGFLHQCSLRILAYSSPFLEVSLPGKMCLAVFLPFLFHGTV